MDFNFCESVTKPLHQLNIVIIVICLGILHGVHWGLGHGIGELIGGFMVSKLGAAATFNIFGVLTLLHLLIFWLINNYSKRRLFPRKGNVATSEEAKEEKEIGNEEEAKDGVCKDYLHDEIKVQN